MTVAVWAKARRVVRMLIGPGGPLLMPKEVSMVSTCRLLTWSLLIACSLINTISANEEEGPDDGIATEAYFMLM